MSNLFEGTPDARQSDNPKLAGTRFRARYRALDEGEKALHDAIKDQAAGMEALYMQVKAGRYNALAITALEESVMWIIKELTS